MLLYSNGEKQQIDVITFSFESDTRVRNELADDKYDTLCKE